MNTTKSTTDVDLTPNKCGKLLKKVIREGEGTDRPASGDEVTVHYIGTLVTGEQFDSSRERGEAFTFKLDDERVIKGWDIGVASMRKGELCQLTCYPEYAYGNKGYPPQIPPAATLNFEVELINWKGEDLTTSRDGGIVRNMLQKGEGHSFPNSGASVTIHFAGSYNGTVFDERKVTYDVGDSHEHLIIDGLDRAVRKFKKGEKSRLVIASKYAFGTDGSEKYSLPPDAAVDYTLELLDFTRSKEHWEMTPSEKLEYAQKYKNKGTELYKVPLISKALSYYQKAYNTLDAAPGYTDDEHIYKQTLRLSLSLNCAQCQLKLENWNKAIDYCEKALNIESQNEKALYRKAQALMGRKDYEDALSAFKIVVDSYPENKAAKKSVVTATKLRDSEKNKIKKKYSGMFQKFVEEDSQKAALKQAKGAISETPIGYWNNSMAQGMMSLQQEMEAFGERMPERSRRSSNDESETSPHQG